MRKPKFLMLILALSFSYGISNASYLRGAFGGLPEIADSSTRPDSFGYTWVDNDNGGSPAFNWVDITDRGIQVHDLGDDNAVGPFQLGFEFPYYWYPVDHLWIGSNGYASFSASWPFTYPYGRIPGDSIPTDLVAPLAGDLDWTDSSHVRVKSCWFWTNNTDSAVISWINASEWSNDHSLRDSTHTFQVIICGCDSSLTFQYGENHGRFSQYGNDPDRDVIGIADVRKDIGLQYLHSNSPPSHLWHNGLVIRFHPEPNPNFVVHDVRVVDGFNIGSKAEFIPLQQPYSIVGFYKNFGTQSEINAKAIAIIKHGTFEWYVDSVFIPIIEPREELAVTLNQLYIPTQAAACTSSFYVRTPGLSGYGQIICELDTYHLPQNLQYFDEAIEWIRGRTWNEDLTGLGIDMEIPEPLKFDSVGIYIYSVNMPGPEYTWVIDSDEYGQPDFSNILAGDTVQIVSPGWVISSFSEVTLPANHRFFIVSVAAFAGTFIHGVDVAYPFSNRGWEYTNGLIPDRYRNAEDVMISIFGESGPTPIRGLIAGMVTDSNANPIQGVIDSLFTGVQLIDVDITDTSGIYSFSPDPGHYWAKIVKQGFRDTSIANIEVFSSETTAVNIRMTPLPTGINSESGRVPVSFSLSQNYPNPFNASTLLSYRLDKAGPVNLAIYNLLGQRVAKLVDGVQDAGEHQITWNSADNSSGIYFARLVVAKKTECIKLVMIK